ncbi:MAG: amidohydrolase family protein [Acidobacteria bacterium]|nr:amidohydrolase family protein [Acidobacteriota bacterium]
MIDVNAYLGHFAFRQLRHNTGAGLVRLMDRFGIERAVVSSAAAITYRNAQAGNEETAAEAASHRSRLIPFAVLSPAYAGWRDDLKICHEQFGMRGLRLYPGWHGYKLADPRCRELVNAAAERNMTISIPVRVEDRRQQSWLVSVPDLAHDEIAGLIRACPKARFVVGNGNGFSGSILGRPTNGLPDNYAIELTWLSAELGNEIGLLLGSLGEDRLLFGTGMPFHYPGPALTKMEILPASETVKEKIRSRNAVRWLGLG